MPAVPQLLTAAALLLLSCIAAYYSRSFMYVRPGFTFSDVGFAALPDLRGTGYGKPLLFGYAACYTVLAVSTVLGLLGDVRWVVLRRLMFVLAVGQLLSIFMQAGTQWNDPDPEWQRGAFVMYPALFVTVWCYLATYAVEETGDSTRRAWVLWTVRGATAVLSIAGCALTVACHVVYTVDVLCIAFNVMAVHFGWEWMTRGPASIVARGALVAWFEADTLALERGVGLAGSALMPRDLPTMPRSDGSERPTERESYGEAEQRLIRHVHEHMPKRNKLLGPLHGMLFALVMILIGAAGFNLPGAVITNGFRPLFQPIMHDTGFQVFHDMGFQLSSTVCDAVLIAMCFVTAVDVMLFQPFPCTSLRRGLTLCAFTYVIRFFFVVASFPPDPTPQQCQFRAGHYLGILDTCGDCVFSGHATALFATVYTIGMFRPGRLVQGFCFAIVTITILLIIGTKLHYTRDTLQAATVWTALHYYLQLTVYSRPDRVGRSEALFSFEGDYYVARAQVMYGVPRTGTVGAAGKDVGGYGSTEAAGDSPAAAEPLAAEDAGELEPVYAATSVWDQVRPRNALRLVRPTGRQGAWFRALLRAPKTEDGRSV